MTTESALIRADAGLIRCRRQVFVAIFTVGFEYQRQWCISYGLPAYHSGSNANPQPDSNRVKLITMPDLNSVTLVTMAPQHHSELIQSLADTLLAECPHISVSHLPLTNNTQLANLNQAIEYAANTKEISRPSEQPSHQMIVILKHCENTTSVTDSNNRITALQSDSPQPGKGCSEYLLTQSVTAAQNADIPVIIASIEHSQPSQPRDHTETSEAEPRTPATTKKYRFHAIKIRQAFYNHDTALLIRQIFAALEIKLTNTSFYAAYPVSPEKPGGSAPLDSGTLAHVISTSLSAWQLRSNIDNSADSEANTHANEIVRTLRFRQFESAIRYMFHVAPACDVAGHHPRWENNWRTLRICLTTWDARQQVTTRDLELARYFDHVYSTYGYSPA